VPHARRPPAELTHTLYQHDAACRVIARLTKERDQARAALSSFSPAAAAAAAAAADGGAMEGVEQPAGGAEVEGAGGVLSSEVVALLVATNEQMSAARKQRSKPTDLVSQDAIKGFAATSSHSGLHSASKGSINHIELKEDSPDLLLTAGDDSKALLFDAAQEKVVATLKGHTKKVTSCVLHPSEDIAVTVGSDQKVCVWTASTGKLQHTIKPHKKTITGVSLHPSGAFVTTCSEDGSWALTDIRSAEVLAHVFEEDKASLSCVQWHPDGLIFGVGAKDGWVHAALHWN